MTSQTTEDPSAKERAQTAASTASDEAKNVAGTAKEQGTQVASEAVGAAKNVAHDVLGNVSGAAREQGGAQRDKLVTTLTSVGDDLSSMADQAPQGLAGDLARQVADQARTLTSRLDGRDPGDILDDVRRFARQRPGVFLLGALAAGVVTGRLLAGARDGIAAAADDSIGSTDQPTYNPTGQPHGGAPADAPDPLATSALGTDPLGSTSLPHQSTHLGDGPETGFSGTGLTGEPPR